LNSFARNIERKWLVAGLSVLFIIACAISIYNNWYYTLLLPFVIFILYLAALSIDKVLLITVFLVPLSIPLEEYYKDIDFNLQLPTEIFLILILAIVLLKVLYENPFNKRLLTHPITLAICFYLLWMFITSLTSSMPLVSLKYLISHLWFITSFYFLATQLFRYKKNISIYVWLYTASFVVVIIYTLYNMAIHGWFNQEISHIAVQPFFRDHTSYGATIAMVLPFSIGFALYRKNPVNLKLLSWFITILLLYALVLSYTRAAWVSAGVAFIGFLIILARIKFRYVFITIIGISAILYANRTEIIMTLERNQQDSSKELTKHLQSIYNIRSDVSNLERINRWKSAIRMFMERPVFGWGPGTYMFQYAPFQNSKDKTYMSTNFGIWGNAHSEYIGPLAESGLLGSLSFILIVVATFYTAFKNISKLKGRFNIRLLLICATLGLMTYCPHGFLNNFLDTDKASALFWGYIAIIVAIDVYHQKKPEKLTEPQK
jgi:O-antigen ligase